MKITIIGAGNIGTLLAGQLTKKRNLITLYTRDISKWNEEIEVIDEDKKISYKERIYKITSNIEEAISDAEIIIITVPAFAMKSTIEKIEKLVKPNTYIGFYPGTGGVEFLSKKLIEKGCIIFGTQRVCSVARVKEYGKSVITSGKRSEMFISSIPQKHGEKVRNIFENLFDIKTSLLPNYLNVTLTPSNPILHTTRLYSIFKDYTKDTIYSRIPLFYEEWTIESSELLIECDNELHNILAKIKELDTSKVKSLLEHYESTDAKSLTEKITSIKSLQGLATPNIKVGNGYLPDLNSRYFTADFPYGLLIIKAFALIVNEETKAIDKVLYWYQNLIKKEYIDNYGNLGKDSKELSLPQNYGLDTEKKLIKFYNL